MLVVCLCAFFLLFVLFLYVRFLCKKKWKSPSNLIYITSDVTIYRHEVILKIFWRCHVSLVKFSYWSKFHVNIITGSRVTTFFFIRNWPDISDIGNTLVWVLHNIWRLGQVGVSNLARMSLVKSYWMLQNFRTTVFAVSELLRESQQERSGKLLPTRTQIRVKNISAC